MGKKVKCIEYDCYMNWSLPLNITKDNLEYAKYCLSFASRTIVCGETMKTKSRSNEQYCKYFVPAEWDKDNSKKLEELRRKIEEFEKAVQNERI